MLNFLRCAASRDPRKKAGKSAYAYPYPFADTVSVREKNADASSSRINPTEPDYNRARGLLEAICPSFMFPQLRFCGTPLTISDLPELLRPNMQHRFSNLLITVYIPLEPFFRLDNAASLHNLLFLSVIPAATLWHHGLCIVDLARSSKILSYENPSTTSLPVPRRHRSRPCLHDSRLQIPMDDRVLFIDVH